MFEWKIILNISYNVRFQVTFLKFGKFYHGVIWCQDSSCLHNSHWSNQHQRWRSFSYFWGIGDCIIIGSNGSRSISLPWNQTKPCPCLMIDGSHVNPLWVYVKSRATSLPNVTWHTPHTPKMRVEALICTKEWEFFKNLITIFQHSKSINKT